MIFVLLGAVGIGALIQGSIGFGFALVVSPVMLVLLPAAVPVAILVLSVPMTIVMILREPHSIDYRACLQISVGRFFGTGIGIWFLSIVPAELTGLLLGGIVLLAVFATLVGTSAAIFSNAKIVAGAFSGIAGSTTALGGAPVALAFQDRTGPEIRATLGLTFLIGDFISIGGLALAGRVHALQFVLAAKLLPALLVGIALSGLAIGALHTIWIRRSILLLAGTGGVLTILRSWPWT